jgi:hypothetical protein
MTFDKYSIVSWNAAVADVSHFPYVSVLCHFDVITSKHKRTGSSAAITQSSLGRVFSTKVLFNRLFVFFKMLFLAFNQITTTALEILYNSMFK